MFLFDPVLILTAVLQRVTKKFDLPTPAVEDVKDYGAGQKQPYVPPPGYVRSSTKPFGDDSAGISYTADSADRVSAAAAPSAPPCLRSAPPAHSPPTPPPLRSNGWQRTHASVRVATPR